VIAVQGPNGLVIVVPDEQIHSLVGDGSRGYKVVPDPRDIPEPVAEVTPAPRKRTPRKTTAKKVPNAE
jgi:hypothetical protein